MKTTARIMLLLLALAASAFGQGNTGSSTSTDISRGNGLRIPQYRTVGSATTTNYYVDPAGSDSNNCMASGAASACLTVQGALNKIPKLLRNNVTVNVAAGTYAGFIVSGFMADNGLQQTTGGLLIQGALANSTLASGSATGTATGGSAGSGSTFGTLVNSGAGWTDGDLVGRIITTASPTNTEFMISANTSTTITIDGTWTTPTGSTTYTIQDPSVVVNTGVSLPATGLSAALANQAAILFTNNNMTYRDGAIALRYMNVAPTTAGVAGVATEDGSSIQLTSMQVRPTGTTVAAIRGPTFSFTAQGGLVAVTKSDIAPLNSLNAAVQFSAGGTVSFLQSNIRTTSANTTSAISMSALTSRLRLVSSTSITGYQSGIALPASGMPTVVVSNVVLTCSGAGTGITLGSATGANVGSVGFSTITALAISGCDIGILASGLSSLDVTSMTGSTTTVGIRANRGAYVTYSKAGVTLTAGGDDWQVNTSEIVGEFADISTNLCASSLANGARICTRP